MTTETVNNEPVVKKFTDADTRLFSIKGVVARFQPEVHYGLQVENPVPLLDTDGKVIGSARVLAEAGTILAEGLCQYGCPERLSIETGIPHFFHPQMQQTFLYVKPSDFAQFGIDVQPEGTKQVPFIVVTVAKLMLSTSPRTDAGVEPVVGAPEDV